MTAYKSRSKREAAKRAAKRARQGVDVLALRIALQPGVCRWCRCTYRDPCPPGCGWADRAQTLCTECVEFDGLLRTRVGRQRAVEAFLISLDVAEAPPAKASR